MPSCHFVGANLWILKTTYQNRGMGIHVFKDLHHLSKLIIGYIKQTKEEITKQQGERYETESKDSQRASPVK